MLKHRIDRLRRLLRRLEVDRRLPPIVTKMATDAVAARWTRRYRRTRALALPIVGDRAASAGIDFWLGRRVSNAVVIDEPRATPTAFAEELQRLCTEAGVACVAVDSSPTQVRLAVSLEERQQLWQLLSQQPRRGLVLAVWRNGRPRALPRRRLHRKSAVQAPVWLALRPVRRGEEVNTKWCRVEFTFWELGASGQREMIGVRHNERVDDGAATANEPVDEAVLTVFSGRPVAQRVDRIHEPIDVVFTWVDASDPDWRQRMLAARSPNFSSSENETDIETAVDWERYESRDELRYALRSIADFAPWVRHIWLITDRQRPTWLIEHPQISVIDHRSIFPTGFVSVFNSHAIEAVLHHVPDLAERFVYFNDDFFLGRPMAPTDFFASDHVVRVFPADAPVRVFEDLTTEAVDTAALRGNEVLRERFGQVARYKLLHSPYPLFRSVLDDIERSIPDLHATTAASQFRSREDLAIASFLAPYWSVEVGKGIISSIDNRYINIESPRLAWITDAVLQFGCDTLCLNQTAASATSVVDADRVAQFLEAMFPVPAPWESTAGRHNED